MTGGRDLAPRDRGRPPHEPTEQTRREVESHAALLIPHRAIAALLGIGPDTLLEHYPAELARGAAAVRRRVAEGLAALAETGDTKALRLLAKLDMAAPPEDPRGRRASTPRAGLPTRRTLD